MQQRIIIDLYDRPNDAPNNAEVAEILDAVATLGFAHEPRLERNAGSGWRTIDRREIDAFSDR